MINIFKIAEKILLAETASLLELARIAETDPKIMYLGADFRGFNLTREDRELIRSCGGLFDEVGDNEGQTGHAPATSSAQPVGNSISEKIFNIRLDILRRYFVQYFPEQREHPALIFSESTLFGLEHSSERGRWIERSFVTILLTEMEKYWRGNEDSRAKIELLKALSRARFSFNGDAYDAISSMSGQVAFGSAFMEIFDLRLCSVRFIMKAIDSNIRNRPGGATSFVRRIVESLDVIPSELGEYLIATRRLRSLSDVLTKVPDVEQPEVIRVLSKLILGQVGSQVELLEVLKDILPFEKVRRQLIYLALRSGNVDIAVAALREGLGNDVTISNIEYSEIVGSFIDFEAALRFGRKVAKLVPNHTLRIIIGEIRHKAWTSEQQHLLKSVFAELDT